MTDAEKLRFLQLVGDMAASIGAVEISAQHLLGEVFEGTKMHARVKHIRGVCEEQADILSSMIDCVPPPLDDDLAGEQPEWVRPRPPLEPGRN